METDQSRSKRTLKGVVEKSKRAKPEASATGAAAEPATGAAEPATAAKASAKASATMSKAATAAATAATPKKPYLIPPKQCMISENGLLLIFVLSQKYIKELTDKEQPIEEGPLKPGVYTWVIILNQDGKPRIYLKPSPNVQEFVSKHVDIVTCIKERGEQCNVAFAGELEVFDEDYSINVNLLSGSYMEKEMKEASKDRTTLKKFKADADTAIRGMLGAFFSTHTVNEVDTSGTGKTFITRGLSNHDLNSFISDAIKRPEDIKIYWFGKDSKAQCDMLRTILNQKFIRKKFSKKDIKDYDVKADIKAFEEAKRISIEEYNGQLVVIKDEDAEGGYSLNQDYTTAVAAAVDAAAAVAAASAEMDKSDPRSAIMGGGALITRRHRLRGRTRKIKRKRTTTKKKIKRNKRSNKRKKRP